MQTLTKTQLDAWECPYCDENDHPQMLQQECCGGALYVHYDKRTSRLVMKCTECQLEVFHIVME